MVPGWLFPNRPASPLTNRPQSLPPKLHRPRIAQGLVVSAPEPQTTQQYVHQADCISFHAPRPGTIGKDGDLMQYAIVFFVTMFVICTCHSDERAARAAKVAEEVRIEREVQRRVEVARREMAERDALLHKVSLIGFIVLTGGAVAGFLWVRRPRSAAPVAPVMPANRAVQNSQAGDITQRPRPQWVNYHAPRAGRVIDLRPVVPSRPVGQPVQHQQSGWIRRRRRRRWNSDRQPKPPRRLHEDPRHP